MNLQKHFEKVQDFRVQSRCYHSLVDILVIVKQANLVEVVSLWLEEEKLSFTQLKVSKRVMELTIPELLDKVAVKGSVISLDAITC